MVAAAARSSSRDSCRLDIFEQSAAIDHDRDRLALDDQLLGEPGVVRGGGGEDLDDVVDAPGADGIALGIVDLHLVALGGPARILPGSVEEDARVGSVGGDDGGVGARVLCDGAVGRRGAGDGDGVEFWGGELIFGQAD